MTSLLKGSLKRLNRKQRALSRKTKGSNRNAKAKRTVAKLHYRISNQRSAVIHEVSDYLSSRLKMAVSLSVLKLTLEDFCYHSSYRINITMI
ncbi:transposase [Endozoicomonas sp. 2B-B]